MQPKSYAGLTNAPDFPATLPWLNTERPISLRDLKGKIVLLDFWTYCCINCIHILPDLKALERKYPELVVIGVHSAKFANEQDAENIRSAILRYDIEHPVLVDNDFYLWRQYAINAWPSFILIDPNGKVYGKTSGEGIFDTFDQLIANMSAEFAAKGLLNKERMDFKLEKFERAGSYLSYPGKIEADATHKRLFFTDSNHNRVVITNPAGDVLEVIGSGAVGWKDGSFAQASFFRPQGLAYDASADALYVADTENHLIRKIDLKTRLVTTIAGTGSQNRGYSLSGKGTNAALNSPWDLQLLNGKLYITMAGPHQIWRMNPDTGELEIYAGSGHENIVDGERLDAALAQPSGITTDGTLLFIADSEVSGIRQIDKTYVKTLIGEGLFEFGDVDGTYPKARLQHAIGVHYQDGTLLVADTYNHKVRKLDPKTTRLSAWLGTGKRGYKDGKAAVAQFNEPNDVAYLDGKYYITDTNNDLVRTYDPATDLVQTLVFRQPDRLSVLALKPESEGIVALSGTPVKLSAIRNQGAELDIVLPKAYAFNAEAPHYLQIGSQRIKPVLQDGVLMVSLPNTSGEQLEAELGIYFCDADHKERCYIKQYHLTLPLSTTADAKQKWQVPLR
jgi:DNA-binding beta-propeller fold protein YncE